MVTVTPLFLLTPSSSVTLKDGGIEHGIAKAVQFFSLNVLSLLR